MTKKWTAEEIRQKLLTDDAWLHRGIKAIYKGQTEVEKNSDVTLEDNGVGFNGPDSRKMTFAAKFLIAKNYLTPKMKADALKRMPKYAGQLARIANGQ